MKVEGIGMKKLIEYIKSNWRSILCITPLAVILLIGVISFIINAVNYFNEASQTKAGCFELGVSYTVAVVLIIYCIHRYVKKSRDEDEK